MNDSDSGLVPYDGRLIAYEEGLHIAVYRGRQLDLFERMNGHGPVDMLRRAYRAIDSENRRSQVERLITKGEVASFLLGVSMGSEDKRDVDYLQEELDLLNEELIHSTNVAHISAVLRGKASRRDRSYVVLHDFIELEYGLSRPVVGAVARDVLADADLSRYVREVPTIKGQRYGIKAGDIEDFKADLEAKFPDLRRKKQLTGTRALPNNQ